MTTRTRLAAVGAAAALALVLSAGPAAAALPDARTAYGNVRSEVGPGGRAPDVWTLSGKGLAVAGAFRAKAQSIGR